VAELIVRARRGDAEALGRALTGETEYLTRYARLSLGHDQVADHVQETLFRAMRSFPSFEGTTAVQWRGWLTAILTNLIRTDRRHPAMRTLPDDSSRDSGTAARVGSRAALIDPRTNPGRAAIDREGAAKLRRAIQCVPEHYRSILLWRYVDSLSFREISGRMKVSEKTARRICGRAILALRAHVGPGHDPGSGPRHDLR
jgi:RNA polymerase sigma-70 factor (ECF subfamily)